MNGPNDSKTEQITANKPQVFKNTDWQWTDSRQLTVYDDTL